MRNPCLFYSLMALLGLITGGSLVLGDFLQLPDSWAFGPLLAFMLPVICMGCAQYYKALDEEDEEVNAQDPESGPKEDGQAVQHRAITGDSRAKTYLQLQSGSPKSNKVGLMKSPSASVISVPSSFNECSICCERQRSVALIPCGHLTCKECSKKIISSPGECPYCRTTLIGSMNIVM